MMDIGGMQCSGCGSTNVQFDAKRRMLICNQCGKEEYYSRSTLNANSKVVYGRQNAIRFFSEGKMEDAHHYAMEVLDISMDNAPAMYIIAYYDEFTIRKPDAMKKFFSQIMDVALEYDEVRDLKELLLASAYNLNDFEEDVIQLMALNMQSEEDASELCGFIDTICPYLISKRTSSGYLTEELSGMYQELAAHCGIPKTCFALVKSIETNPDSPYTDNSFYLKAKSQYFYENYIVRIKNIILAIRDVSLRDKFMTAYQRKCEKYRNDAGLA
jgi:hypothetical protein